MKTLTITESKAQLSALVEKVLRTGQPITIGRGGKPMVQLVPFVEVKSNKRLDAFQGQITMAPDYDTWGNEEAHAFGLLQDPN